MSINKRGCQVLQLAAVFLLASCSGPADDTTADEDAVPADGDFNYLSVQGEKIRTLHELKYEFSIAGDFHIVEPKNRVDTFSGTPYQISLSAFISEATTLMIHAEEVADQSGASDYSDLAASDWPDPAFRHGGLNCLQVPVEAIEGEHDLLWLRSNGFEPTGDILFSQYFVTTEDMNAEIVVSILHKVSSCDDVAGNSEQLVRQIQDNITIQKYE